jgi:alkylhydroperoxidase/carboxymuconolactone decarboxylase family protein YurZ
VCKEVEVSKNDVTKARKPTLEMEPWDAALTRLSEWDPAWAEACVKVTTDPWTNGVLPRKTVELIRVALSAAWTNLNPDSTRRHIRAALEVGATRDEILLVLKMACIMSLDAGSLVVPILLEEATESDLDAAAVGRAKRLKEANATPTVDKIKADGRWNTAWDPFYDLVPVWTDQFMTMGVGIYTSGVLPTKEIELLSIAFDASYTHMYAPGTRRHIRNALRAGASVDEIMAVLKLCVVQGVEACKLGIPILAEELARHPTGNSTP